MRTLLAAPSEELEQRPDTIHYPIASRAKVAVWFDVLAGVAPETLAGERY